MKTRQELQKLIETKLGKDHYFQSYANQEKTIINYGIKLTADDFMDDAGKIKLEDLIK